ncbi:MAG: uroporphyrinogen-III C-methyltransferase [Chloroflexi bacterium]|nr:uroporphyrinogen-III C-methyltransferase [Chloroflexota bacterium]
MASGGIVHLVGAGPGDPGLITVRGARLLRRADVIVYDRLVNPSLLAEARPDAEMVDVGKPPSRGGEHLQEEINELLIERARGGARVLRLKGGDPFLFGRGGEEAAALAEAGVSFDVVPGVTSALAGPAYAGIPATDRNLASAVRIYTGQQSRNPQPLSPTNQTSIVLMGVRTLANTVRAMLMAGWPEDTPAAVIEQATTSRQRTTTATLETIVGASAEVGIRPPAIFICGNVVGLRDSIGWLEKKPLFGHRLMVLRGETRAAELITLLDDAGAEVVHVPAVAFDGAEDWTEPDSAIERLVGFQVIAFTSVNGVDFFMSRLLDSGRDARSLAAARIAAIGPATAAALNRHGLNADLVPGRFTTGALADAIASESEQGDTVLLPRGNLADDALPAALREHGLEPTPIVVYRTLPGPSLAERAKAAMERGIDAVLLTSPSTARNLVEALGDDRSLLDGIPVISAGPTTSRGAENVGLRVAQEATEHTADGLVDAALAWAGSN